MREKNLLPKNTLSNCRREITTKGGKKKTVSVNNRRHIYRNKKSVENVNELCTPEVFDTAIRKIGIIEIK